MKYLNYCIYFCLYFFFLSCASEEDLNELQELTQKNNDGEVEAIISERDAGVICAYKKAQQFLNINWECLNTIPTREKHAGYAKGTHKGLPYSSVKEYNKFIGYDVSIRTFMTALRNKYSLLYTEDVLKSRSMSSYGIKYQGGNCGAYMGTVCSFFVDYVLGFKIPYVTKEYDYLSKIGIFEKVDGTDINSLKLMDVIWEPGHANIITNIYRDKKGNVSKIIWSESVSPYVKSTKMTPSQFYNRLLSKGGIIYRYTNIKENKYYEPSEFVTVLNEEKLTYNYNDDICTFAGDFACFSETDIIVINYEKSIYETMELYKDDNLYTIIDLPTDPENHSIYLEPLKLSYGSYKARLANNDKVSDYTYFEILQTDVEYENYGDYQKVSFTSANSSPLYIQFCLRNGNTQGKYVLTDTDVSNGYALLNAKEIYKNVYGSENWSGTVYMKVFFQGKYGRATNAFLKTDLK